MNCFLQIRLPENYMGKLERQSPADPAGTDGSWDFWKEMKKTIALRRICRILRMPPAGPRLR